MCLDRAGFGLATGLAFLLMNRLFLCELCELSGLLSMALYKSILLALYQVLTVVIGGTQQAHQRGINVESMLCVELNLG